MTSWRERRSIQLRPNLRHDQQYGIALPLMGIPVSQLIRPARRANRFDFACRHVPPPQNARFSKNEIREAFQGRKRDPVQGLKISFYENRKSCFFAPVPPPHEGRFAVVTDVGGGMRWLWRCRATSDAAPPPPKNRPAGTRQVERFGGSFRRR